MEYITLVSVVTVGIIIDSRVEGYGLKMHLTHVISLPLTSILNAACPLTLPVLRVTWKIIP